VEDEERAAAIKQGESDYECELTTNIRGIPIDRPARPACLLGYCCGAAFDETTGVTVETCQRTTATTYTFRPMRAKNATRNPATRDIPFTCIDGAYKIAVSAAALVATAFMMA